MKRDLELKKAIVNWYCERYLRSISECVEAFRQYIYDEKGEYLIGGRDVSDFIENIRNIIYS